MPSRNKADLEDFLAGTVSTQEDSEALHRVRALDTLDPVSYLQFLVTFSELHPPTREIPPRHEPFVL